MNVRRIFGTTAALALAAGGVLASSAPVQAAGIQVTVCNYFVTSVRALDLQEDGVNSTDEIWVVINGNFFQNPSTTFFKDQTRLASALGSPHASSTTSVSIGLVEDDVWPDGNDTLDADTVSCAAEPDGTLVISDNSDYEYLVNYRVTVTQS